MGEPLRSGDRVTSRDGKTSAVFYHLWGLWPTAWLAVYANWTFGVGATPATHFSIDLGPLSLVIFKGDRP